MPQLKGDEWPEDEEPTTTEQEVPMPAADIRASTEFRWHLIASRVLSRETDAATCRGNG